MARDLAISVLAGPAAGSARGTRRYARLRARCARRASGYSAAPTLAWAPLGHWPRESQLVADLGQARQRAVLVGQQRRLERPADADVRVVPHDAVLVLGAIQLGALVLQLRALARRAEAVEEA